MTDVLNLEMVSDAKGSEGILTVEHYELVGQKVIIEGKISGIPKMLKSRVIVQQGLFPDR